MSADLIDLHVHSTASDGTFSPAELVTYALQKGLRAMALTDHDTVAGLQEAQYAAAGTSLSIVCGIEFSTDYHEHDIHIVGLDIDPAHPELASYLTDFLRSRDRRNAQMIARLQKAGFSISEEAMQSRFGDCILTRAHIARFLMEQGYVSEISEAFSQYLGEGCPYYVPREKVTPVKAVQLIDAAGGIPVLAHPLLYHLKADELEQLLLDLKAVGLIAMEVLYSTHSDRDVQDLTALAAKHQLLPSGGSDFHGSNKPGLDLGCGYGNLQIPYDILEDLRNAKKRRFYED